uniref:C3H1-type domain-containing protein n=1 Tax=Panagrellus redivivus TaxID=6233 RepID=A0A7E4W482_PANRE
MLIKPAQTYKDIPDADGASLFPLTSRRRIASLRQPEMYQNMTPLTVQTAASSDDGSASSSSGPKSGCRTKYCLEFKREGVCSYGDQCRYAHDITDLTLPVPAPPNYEKVPCRTYSVYGTCPYGTQCQFAHIKEDPAETLNTSSHAIQSQPTQSATSFGLPSDWMQYFKKPSMLNGVPCPTYSVFGYCLLGGACMFVHQEKGASASPAIGQSSGVANLNQSTYVNSPSSSPWPECGYDEQYPALPNADNTDKTVLPTPSITKRPSTSTDSSLGSSIDLLLDCEAVRSTPEPVPTHEIWPLKPEHVLEMSRLSIGAGPSAESIEKKYPSSLIVLKPIYDAWQRVQKEPWGKPKKRSDGGFDPFFY